ncbi:histidine phosphatase family protein [Pseudorhizobium flavum]|uniref:histidine phosphatase family protein n=1 Tax=Pseudorhizobium flavum TaxID=1335061 RepID=UPI00376F9635
MTKPLPTLLVIRHGETQWNLAGRLQGRRDSPLTLNGVRQTLAVAVRLSETISKQFWNAAFWVSPLGRARQTASILADSWSLPFNLFGEAPDVLERNYGVWEGLTQQEIRDTYPDQFASHGADPWGFLVPQGESRTMLTSRVASWLQQLDPAVPHVVVTHSGCLRALRGIYEKALPDEILQYREAQTSSFLLSSESCTALDVPSSVLKVLGCSGAGGTVWI